MASSTRGSSHIRLGTRKQDAFRCFVPQNSPNYLICVVSDGAGSAELGGEGASLVCRTISLLMQQHLKDESVLPSDELILSWVDQTRDRIAYAASQRSKTVRDFAATMICLVSNGSDTLVAQVGDGCAAFKEVDSTGWKVPLWPDHGEYASTTNFITDDPEAKIRITRSSIQLSAIAVLTDGLERLSLDFSSLKPHDGFFNGIAKPLLTSNSVGKDRTLSKILDDYLQSETICSRTDDDKTLVVASLA